MQDDEPTIAELWAEVQEIAARPLPGDEIRVTVAPVAATLSEAHLRAETEQRPVLTTCNGHPVMVFPIGSRPEPRT